jgi:hypothetical protein
MIMNVKTASVKVTEMLLVAVAAYGMSPRRLHVKMKKKTVSRYGGLHLFIGIANRDEKHEKHERGNPHHHHMARNGNVKVADFYRGQVNFAEGFKFEGVSVSNVVNDIEFLVAVLVVFNIGRGCK